MTVLQNAISQTADSRIGMDNYKVNNDLLQMITFLMR